MAISKTQAKQNVFRNAFKAGFDNARINEEAKNSASIIGQGYRFGVHERQTRMADNIYHAINTLVKK